MPRKQCNHMDERLPVRRLAAREGEDGGACREFGSRKTGHKILTRYNDIGLEGLTDRSRRSYHHPTGCRSRSRRRSCTSSKTSRAGARPGSGRSWRAFPGVHTPAISTVHAVLDCHGLVKHRMGRRIGREGNRTFSSQPRGALRHEGSVCVPGLRGRLQGVRAAQDIRTDSGVPFASPNSSNLSKLSVWWLRARYRAHQAGRPQQNGRHERMHLTLKLETRPHCGLPELDYPFHDKKRAGRVHTRRRALGRSDHHHKRNSRSVSTPRDFCRGSLDLRLPCARA
jgi:putative transposase